MSLACLVFAAILSATACPPTPPAIVEQLGEATLLRPDVETAIHITNEALRASEKPFRVVASWQLNGRGLSEHELAVYLIRSPARARLLARERTELEATIAAMASDFGGIADGAEHCSDLDKCVETLYPEATTNLVMEVLNRLNAWELAKTSPECRCIVLIEQDLQLYRIVFGADWDRYVLWTRFDNADELRAALANDRIPKGLLDGESVPLEAMVAFLLLHEIGHLSEVPLQISTGESVGNLKSYLDGLNPEQIEELRADSFVVRVLAQHCFGQNPTGLVQQTCTVPPVLGMLTFVVGMKGKSKDARCLRYLDTVPGYPNWQARLLLLNYQYVAESKSGHSLLLDYLSTREQLLKQPWIVESEVCHRAALLSSAARPAAPASAAH